MFFLIRSLSPPTPSPLTQGNGADIKSPLSLFLGKSAKSSQTCCPRIARHWGTRGRSLFLNRESRAVWPISVSSPTVSGPLHYARPSQPFRTIWPRLSKPWTKCTSTTTPTVTQITALKETKTRSTESDVSTTPSSRTGPRGPSSTATHKSPSCPALPHPI